MVLLGDDLVNVGTRCCVGVVMVEKDLDGGGEDVDDDDDDDDGGEDLRDLEVVGGVDG
jgi:hypothetical protein